MCVGLPTVVSTRIPSRGKKSPARGRAKYSQRYSTGLRPTVLKDANYVVSLAKAWHSRSMVIGASTRAAFLANSPASLTRSASPS